jgi:DNA-binding IclR family transcriptional regulator
MTVGGGDDTASEDSLENTRLPDGDRKFVVALARGLEVLRAFRARDGFLSNQEIAVRTGLPKPTVTRLTYTLCQLGYLMQNPRLGKYQLAAGAITLGYSALANLGIRHVAHGFMNEAAEALAAPVALGVVDQHKALYIDISRGSATFTVQLDIGSRLPLATSAMGRALLVGLPGNEREEKERELANAHPALWPQIKTGIDQALSDYHRHGFVVSRGEWRDDINGAAVPLHAADGSGLYAFNCGAPPHHFPHDRLYAEIGPAMVALARVVDDTLNGKRTARHDTAWLPAIGDETSRPESLAAGAA